MGIKKILGIITVIFVLFIYAAFSIFNNQTDENIPKNEEIEIVDLENATIEQIVERAKNEGMLESVCISSQMAGMNDILDTFTRKYGIEHKDCNSDIFSEFQEDKSKALGITDLPIAEKAAEQGILQQYKNSYWDYIPDWAKDKNMFWVSAFAGCTSFLYNHEATGESVPCSWKDVKNGNYKITLGNAALNKTAQSVVIASAYAFGGDIENLEPAFEFWLEMAEAGRIDSGDILIPRISSGEIELGITWSYESVFYKNLIENNNVYIKIPSDGSVLVGNALVINKNTDTPFSAALFSEFLFSDECQTALAENGAYPTRTDLMIPKEIEEKTFDAEDYKKTVVISDYEKYLAACIKVAEWWEENISSKID